MDIDLGPGLKWNPAAGQHEPTDGLGFHSSGSSEDREAARTLKDLKQPFELQVFRFDGPC